MKLLNTAHANDSDKIGTMLARRLRCWREQKDIPIKRAAADLGVSPATWDHWEKCRRFPSMDDLDLLAQYLDLSPCLMFCPELRDKCGYCGRQEKQENL